MSTQTFRQPILKGERLGIHGAGTDGEWSSRGVERRKEIAGRGLAIRWLDGRK